MREGTRFGLLRGEMSGEARGVQGVRGETGDRGVPGVRVSELNADDIVLKLEGDMSESVDVELQSIVDTRDGAISFVSSDDVG